MRFLPLLLALGLAGCAHAPETKASRDHLNCVYHWQYEMGLSKPNAEARCK